MTSENTWPERFHESSPRVNSHSEDFHEQSATTFDPSQPWKWNVPSASATPGNMRPNSRFTDVEDGIKLCPDRLLASTFVNPEIVNQRATFHMSSKVPAWMLTLLSFVLGINYGQKASSAPMAVASCLYIVTCVSGVCYGICGLVFNIYDTISEYTRTTVVISCLKCFMGLFWILLGIYAHSLSSRLLSKKGLIDFIRLHSKTFMKVNTSIWVAFLCTSVIAVNLYCNTYLLYDTHNDKNETKTIDATCGSVGVNLLLCQTYFGSKVLFSSLTILWNLIIMWTCFSVCRTHTICLRRFQKELVYDSKIYEEYCLMALTSQKPHSPFLWRQMSEYDVVDYGELLGYEDDIRTFNESVLLSVRSLRESHMTYIPSNASHAHEYRRNSINGRKLRQRSSQVSLCERIQEEDEDATKDDVFEENHFTDSTQEKEMEAIRTESFRSRLHDKDHDIFHLSTDTDNHYQQAETDLVNMKPPTMSNEDISFTYFKLVKHLRTTSRLLQRWTTSVVIFVMMWCAMLIIYWTTHSSSLWGIYQFLIPVVILIFLTSAYAEVNFEANRIVKNILPLQERMSVLYYIHNTSLELKAYTFVLTYTVIATGVAGVIVSIATRIILSGWV